MEILKVAKSNCKTTPLVNSDHNSVHLITLYCTQQILRVASPW